MKILAATFLLAFAMIAGAQTGRIAPPKVEIAFNRFYDHAAMTEILRKLEKAWPQFLTLETLGKSTGGREMWLMTVQNPKTGPADGKAAMWIDANVHGNEVQGTEVCLYTIWFLMENYGKVERVTKLVDDRVFYILPCVNPDGRDHWFHAANTSSTSRSGIGPTDNDRDGLFDEDPPDDLDGDGNITRMRKYVGTGGRYKLNPDDPREMIRVGPGEDGDWEQLGSEGIDNDADGRFNEDGVGGYDMNRNNPADWEPPHIQFGASDYPFVWPETRCVGEFLAAHPNIAAVQSYHNTGGMILRGPGAKDVPEYPSADLRVYDKLGRDGARILPFYRYMILFKDLYTVYGGFVNYAAEGLGIISFTNELWSRPEYFKDKNTKPDDRRAFDDLVDLGMQWVDWKKFDHPQHGEIEIGGWTKWASRVPPAYMLEELCHRNTAFTLIHAEAMPRVSWGDSSVTPLGDDLFRVRVELKNSQIIPTRTAMAAQKKIGLPDFLSISGGAVVAAGTVTGRFAQERISPIRKDMARLRLEHGVPGEGEVRVEWIVSGAGPYTIRYVSEKGGRLEARIGN